MNFIVDAQLPPALVDWLVEQGHEAMHVADLGLRDATDGAIWAQAQSQNAIILTKDADFAERAARDSSGPVIVWLRVGNATNRSLLQWIWPRWPQIISLLEAQHRLIEVR